MKSEVLDVINVVLKRKSYEKCEEYGKMLGFIPNKSRLNGNYHEKWFLQYLKQTKSIIESKFTTNEGYISTDDWENIFKAVESDATIEQLLKWFKINDEQIELIDIALEQAHNSHRLITFKDLLISSQKQDIINASVEFVQYINHLIERFSDEEMTFVKNDYFLGI